MFTKDEFLRGRDKQFPNDYTDEVSANLDKLVEVMNQVRDAYGKPMITNSGWRPPTINATTPGAAKGSKHTIGLACDIADPDGTLWQWVLDNLTLMQQLDIYLEDKRWCKGWVHFGLGAPISGKRIFIPNAHRPTDPDIWDGQYDHTFDS